MMWGKAATMLGTKLPTLSRPFVKAVSGGADDAASFLFRDGIPKYAKHTGYGAGLGGLSGSIGELIDDEEGFDPFEVAKDVGIGALTGGLLGGSGAMLAGRGKLLGSMGDIGKLLGHGVAAISPLGRRGIGGIGVESPAERPAGLGGMLPTSNSGSGLLGLLTGSENRNPLGLDPVPTFTPKSLAEYMRDEQLNSVVDSAISTQINPLGRQVKQVVAERNNDLAMNINLGENVNAQMGQIARDQASNAQAIAEAATAAKDAAADHADDVVASSQAGIRNEQDRNRLAEEQAANEQRLADNRISDAELLRRLGASGQSAIQEIRAAEQMQTGMNAQAIRTEANQQVRDLRGKMSDIRGGRLGMLHELAQQQMDSDVRRHEFGLGAWKAKLDAAVANAGVMQDQMKMQAELAGGGQEMSAEMLTSLIGPKGSTMNVMNEATGGTDNVPYIAGLPEDQVIAMEQRWPGYGLYQTWARWQGVVPQVG